MLFWVTYLLFFIFILGIYGLIINRSNLIQMLISLEILLLSLLLNFSIIVLLNINILSLIISLLITVIAASESALGLIIIVLFYKIRGSISSKTLTNLKNKWLFLIFLI